MEREARDFTCKLELTGHLVATGDKIRLHALKLEISDATIDGKAATATLDKEANEVSLSTGQELAEGQHLIKLTAKGKITDPMHGIYPCYFKHGGKAKEVLATQLESHYAREVFPVIDEPEAKATFDLTLTTEPGITVLGNTPVKEQAEKDGKLVSQFETTPKMSPYLLAWVAGELQSRTGKTKDGVEVGIWSTPAQKIEGLDFALDTTIRAIEYYDDYFGVPYPLAKCDMVALPDFSAGAMENWGLITFREVALLADPKNTSIPSKQYVAMVICHELAHQWFGNLVTMKWWDDLWLNESFANLMEYMIPEQLFPKWDFMVQLATQDSLQALRRDRLKGVQAVRTGVNHPDEISTLFDPSIVYAKGGQLLLMLHGYVGDEAWRKGLETYFTRHKYGNTEASDLWEALGDASGKDVSALMMPWLTRPGFPMLTVEQQDNDTYNISQQRFLSNPGDRQEDKTAPWPVPLLANQKTDPELLSSASSLLKTEGSDRPLKLNTDQKAHYLTYYASVSHREALQKAVADKTFGEIDRLHLLHEALLLSAGGVKTHVEVLELLEAYRGEQSHAVWDIVALAIGETRKLIEDNEAATDDLRRLTAELITSEYERLGWDKKDDESDFDTILRGTILGLGVFAEHKPVIDEALKRFNAFEKPEDLDADLRDVIYRAGVKFGGQPAFDKLVKLYEQTDYAEEQLNLCVGLTATENQKQIDFLISKLKDTNFVRPQDFARWFAYLIRNRFARKTMWEWLTKNWDGWIHETFGSDKSYDMLPRYAASAFGVQEELDKYKAFFLPYTKDVSIKRAIEVGVEDIQARVLWHDRDAKAVVDYLAKR